MVQNPGAYQNYLQRTMPGYAKRDLVWREVSAYLQRYVPTDSRVLDLGAGYGHFINHIQAKSKVAFDLSDTLLKYCRPDVTPVVGNALELASLLPAGFRPDRVFASNFLEHFSREDIVSLLKTVFTLLSPGGKVLLLQPNYRYCSAQYFDDFTHLTALDHVSLPQALEVSGFEVETVKPKFLPYSMQSRLPTHPLLVRLYLNLPVKPLGKQMLVLARKPA